MYERVYWIEKLSSFADGWKSSVKNPAHGLVILMKSGAVIEVEPHPLMCIWFDRGVCTFYRDTECAGVAFCRAYEKDNRIEY